MDQPAHRPSPVQAAGRSFGADGHQPQHGLGAGRGHGRLAPACASVAYLGWPSAAFVGLFFGVVLARVRRGRRPAGPADRAGLAHRRGGRRDVRLRRPSSPSTCPRHRAEPRHRGLGLPAGRRRGPVAGGPGQRLRDLPAQLPALGLWGGVDPPDPGGGRRQGRASELARLYLAISEKRQRRRPGPGGRDGRGRGGSSRGRRPARSTARRCCPWSSAPPCSAPTGGPWRSSSACWPAAPSGTCWWSSSALNLAMVLVVANQRRAGRRGGRPDLAHLLGRVPPRLSGVRRPSERKSGGGGDVGGRRSRLVCAREPARPLASP